MSHHLHRVSAKVALYNFAHTDILLVENRQKELALPGGHIEKDETPEQAIQREVREELGIDINASNLQRKDFWVHTGGKIVLAFTGTLDMSTKLTIDPLEIRSARWIPVLDIKNKLATAGKYDQFIINNS